MLYSLPDSVHPPLETVGKILLWKFRVGVSQDGRQML